MNVLVDFLYLKISQKLCQRGMITTHRWHNLQPKFSKFPPRVYLKNMCNTEEKEPAWAWLALLSSSSLYFKFTGAILPFCQTLTLHKLTWHGANKQKSYIGWKVQMQFLLLQRWKVKAGRGTSSHLLKLISALWCKSRQTGMQWVCWIVFRHPQIGMSGNWTDILWV